jgi:hypothetical protein
METWVCIGAVADIGSTVENPDFYMRRIGDIRTIGKVFMPNDLPADYRKDSFYGVKLNELGESLYVPKFFFYTLLDIHNRGLWRQLGNGSTDRVSLTVKKVKDMPLFRVQLPSAKNPRRRRRR